MTENGKNRMAEAGAKNLAKFNQGVAEGKRPPQNLKHGALSKHIHKRYRDKRTKEGRRLKAIIDGIVADLGGPSEISNTQNIILSNIRLKLIVIFQIIQYSQDNFGALIGDDGKLVPCLDRNIIFYMERWIQANYILAIVT